MLHALDVHPPAGHRPDRLGVAGGDVGDELGDGRPALSSRSSSEVSAGTAALLDGER